MVQLRARSCGATVSVTDLDRPDQLRAVEAMAALGDVAYAARLPDGLVKIGWTHDLSRRLMYFGRGTELLAFRLGMREDELTIHRALKDHRARGREYYHFTPEVVARVNEMRTDVGLDPLVA